MKKFLSTLLFVAGTPLALASNSAFAEEEYGVLFLDKGVEETYSNCASCHSEKIVAQQGLTRDGWEELIEWMIEEQDMWEIEEPELTLILDYLEKNYGPDRPNFPKN